MPSRTTVVLACVGAVLIVTGLALGLWPSSTLDSKAIYPSGFTRSLDCGSPWATNYGDAAEQAFALSPTEAAQRCEDTHGSRAGIGLLALGLGLATLIELGVVAVIRHAIRVGEAHLNDSAARTAGESPSPGHGA